MKTPIRKSLLPLIISVGFVVYLGLWVTYELLKTFSDKRKKQYQTTESVYYIVKEVVKAELTKDSISRVHLEQILQKIADKTNIEHIRLDYNGKPFLTLKNNPIDDKTVFSSKKGFLTQGKLAAIWGTILFKHEADIGSSGILFKDHTISPTASPPRLLVVLNTKKYLIDTEASERLLLVVLLLGFGGVIIFTLAWSYSIRYRNLQTELQYAKNKQDQIEELSLAATGLAHETKNPLGIIRGLAQQIADNKSNSTKARQMAEEIMEEADITTARLGDFLSYAKMRSPELTPLHAVEHINRMKDLVIDDFKNANINLITEVEDLMILADPEMLSQILLNLLMNSLKSVNNNDSVSLLLEKTWNNTATLSVIDTGSGIPTEILPNIFKPYVSKRADGYGIGLAIVKRIVEQSGWEINIDSKQGKGTRVIITGIETASGKS